MKIAIGILMSVIIVLLCYPIIDIQVKNSQRAAENERKAADYRINTVLIEDNDGMKTELSYRDYMIGCLFAQIPSFYEEDMLKTQAIVVNTYSIYAKLNGKAADDFVINDGFQPYIAADAAKEYYGSDYVIIYGKLAAVADFGMKYVITYNGEPILPAAHSISSGKTDSGSEVLNGDYPYLKSVDSALDIDCEQYYGSRQLSSAAVRGILMKQFSDIELPIAYSDWFTDFTYTESGCILSLTIGNKSLSGTQLCELFSLRSSNADISYSNGFFTFKTKGFGHNVGMSIYGGNEMVKSGASIADVINYYYTNVTIEKIPDR